MRVLMDRLTEAEIDGSLDDEQLRELYAVPRLPWLRVNMVHSADGAATGANGKTGSINNAADKRVFDMLRASSDAIVVGAGTARAEGYAPTSVPTVLVSRGGSVPESLRDGAAGTVLMATCSQAPALAETTELLGPDNVLVHGEETVELVSVRGALHERGLRSLLCEGGPSLLTQLLEAGQVDELCITTVPTLVGGHSPRITGGPGLGGTLELGLLLEEEGTLLARWLVSG